MGSTPSPTIWENPMKNALLRTLLLGSLALVVGIGIVIAAPTSDAFAAKKATVQKTTGSKSGACHNEARAGRNFGLAYRAAWRRCMGLQ